MAEQYRGGLVHGGSDILAVAHQCRMAGKAVTDPVALLKPLRDRIPIPGGTPINKDDEIAELAKLPGTKCVYLGDQFLLLEPGAVKMVTVSNGLNSITCTAAKAAAFNLYPEES